MNEKNLTEAEIMKALECCGTTGKSCKDCVHYEVCGGFTPTDLDKDVFDYCREGRSDEIPNIEERCSSFKPKSRFVELPCEVGQTLYFFYDNRYADKPDKKTKIYETKDWYFDIDEKGISILPRSVHGYKGKYHYYLNETVFLSREEAEKALAERSK